MAKTEEEEIALIVKCVGAGVGAIILLVLFFGSYTVINPGDAGVIFNEITGSLYTAGQGIVFKVPFVTKVQDYPVSLRTYTMVKKATEGSSKEDDSVDLPTLEGQHIRQDISVTYNTSQDKAAEVFRSFKGAEVEDIEKTFIRRTIITVAQNASGQMSLSELISSKRGQLQQTMQEALSVELGKMGFMLDKVNLGASHLPEAIEQQMQEKMGAQQKAQQAEYELQKASTLAKAEVAKARGEADSRLIRAKADAESNGLLRQSVNAELIKLRTVERWNGELPKFIFGGGSIPMFNMDSLVKDKKVSHEAE